MIDFTKAGFPWRLLIGVEAFYIVLSTLCSLFWGVSSFEGETVKSIGRFLSLVIYVFIYRRHRGLPQTPHVRWSHPLLLLLLALLLAAPLPIAASPQQNLAWTALFTATSFLVGFREELFYRAFVQAALTSRLGPLRGILIGSAIFTVYHVYYFVSGDWISVLEVFLYSLTMGTVYYLTRNLLLASLVHSVYDAIFIVGPLGAPILPPSAELCILLVTTVFSLLWLARSSTGEQGLRRTGGL